MKVHLGGGSFLVGALVAAAAALAVGFFAVLGVRSGVAGPDPAPPAAPPNPGHSYSQVELPASTWSGLDADLLDGLQASEIMGRLGFSTTVVDDWVPPTSHSNGAFSMTVGADGLPLISYCGHNLTVAHCGNAACSAGNTITIVDSTANVGQFNSVTVGADGLPVISYQDATNLDLKVAHCGNVACSAGNTITTVDSTANVDYHTSVTVGVDGLPVISYYAWTGDIFSGNLKVAHCGNAACSAGNTITTVDGAVGVGIFSEVTVGADGLPVISYQDWTNVDVKVAHCGNAACSAGNTLTTVDSTDRVGDPSVTVGTDGLPVISYGDADNRDLKVAHCGNAACSVGNTLTTVDSTGDVGDGSSVTVGADGLPVVTYYAWTGDVKVAHCSNAACTSATIITVDSITQVGGPTSVTVGVDGLPVIGYYDYTNWDLWVAHCSNRFCVPYHRPR